MPADALSTSNMPASWTGPGNELRNMAPQTAENSGLKNASDESCPEVSGVARAHPRVMQTSAAYAVRPTATKKAQAVEPDAGMGNLSWAVPIATDSTRQDIMKPLRTKEYLTLFSC
eukprot:CAMPEP_0177388810 /NCGR_PEP_ID=MMETSP0368-20130122/52180_1 /TAXON_ID=447022 ORGANISM="Scrippsiella hangoei-like, Strain SHHI-4" /NCGR_SAMPLE_ID=MMETSP0368 /ASSEMBLY_ACC=CAM_ASM_000363 /LENGTH=115 /DNA_ID=CAMNT_0018854079 /DNA_START=214 /DNA_END=561 /DNA_ORIENTATION=+